MQKKRRDKMFKNGMAQVENEPGENLYDRCYVFSDTNYINKNNDEKQSVLLNLMTFLKSMSASFKITVANEYQDMDKFISDIFNDMNSAEYPLVSAGIKRWIDEKIEDAKLHDLKRMLYLTITVKSPTYDEARSYFLAMDSELDTMFKAMKSFIVPLDGIKRLNVLRNFFYQEEKEEYNFDDDVLYDAVNKTIIDAGQESYSSSFFKAQKGNKVLADMNELNFKDGRGIGVNYMPNANSPVLTAASFDNALLDNGFDKVDYIGAFGINDNWLDGWTNFDPNNTDY